jgi:hypothetical protein
LEGGSLKSRFDRLFALSVHKEVTVEVRLGSRWKELAVKNFAWEEELAEECSLLSVNVVFGVNVSNH